MPEQEEWRAVNQRARRERYSRREFKVGGCKNEGGQLVKEVQVEGKVDMFRELRHLGGQRPTKLRIEEVVGVLIITPGKKANGCKYREIERWQSLRNQGYGEIQSKPCIREEEVTLDTRYKW
ncbi:hypothetical protein GOP47_0021232 [Adiantum capillus-veneris]|uniref:Uncharacterized protein n=1 Tax=Adiantum capillus-veneris TaxID=13818 RepID=A0A9D4UB49_ADICA|nr:hypothetical protein GOP47_0021232 [Adiantum capillus-veneris]